MTRGTSNNLYSPQSVQGPMARNIPDLALFLDTMAGFCPQDAMTFDAPAVSFSAAVANPVAPRRVAWTADFGGRFELDRDVREICTKMARRFEELGCIVEEVTPDFGPVDEVFMALRSQQFVVDRELQLEQHRDKIKADIIWNTELGFKQTTRQLAWAERERAALYRRMVEFWQKYDLLVTPSAPTAAFDVNLRAPPTINGKKLDNYMSGSTLNSAITVTGSPAVAVPCGFDPYGRPVGLQLVGKPRGEAALLQAASLYESLVGLSKLLPIDPQARHRAASLISEIDIHMRVYQRCPSRFRNGAIARDSNTRQRRRGARSEGRRRGRHSCRGRALRCDLDRSREQALERIRALRELPPTGSSIGTKPTRDSAMAVTFSTVTFSSMRSRRSRAARRGNAPRRPVISVQSLTSSERCRRKLGKDWKRLTEAR